MKILNCSHSIRYSFLIQFILFIFHHLTSSTNVYCQTQIFDFTGSNQFYTVPPGVNAIRVKMWGAGGGSGDNTNCGNGGGGAYVEGILCVTPGETLTIIVGEGGARGTANSSGAFNGSSAFGGGGIGRQEDRGGGNGGGRSAIRRGSTELATAGGGGGGGGSGTNSGNGTRYCGGGGGAVGGNGTRGGDRDGCATGSGGCGGTPTGTQNCTNAPDGGQFFGGNGENIGNQTYGGGGGGGGYYGGEGGNSGGNNSGGGGGGSSFFSIGPGLGTLITSQAGNSGSVFTAGNSSDPDNNNQFGGGGSRGSSTAANTGSPGQHGRIVISPATSVIAGPITGNNNICVNGSTQLSASPAGGAWSSSNSGVASVNSSGLVTGISPGTATIFYTISSTCGNSSSSFTVTVTGAPALTPITGNPSVCVGATTTLSNSTPGGIWSSSNNAIATVNSNGIVTGTSAGNATISYTLSNSCGTSTENFPITVIAAPAVPPITGTFTLCTGNTAQLNNSLPGGVWASNNPAVANINPTTGLWQAISPDTTTITYSVSNQCGTVVASQQVNVIGPPSVDTISGPANVCTGGTITLSNNTPGGTWATSDPSKATVNTSGVVNGVSAGAVTISYSVTGICGTTTVTKNINVDPIPNAPPISGNTQICLGDSAQLSNIAPGGAWSSSNPTVATINSNGLVKGVSTGSTTISYNVSVGGCAAVSSTIVNILPRPAITNVNVKDITCPSSADGSIEVFVSGGTAPYNFSIDNGVTYQQSSSFTNLNSGSTYNVVVRDALGCSQVYFQNPVSIIGPAPITLNINTTSASCSGVSNGVVVVQATGGNGGFQYSLNNGPFQTSNVFNNLANGSYTVLVKDLNNCTASASANVSVLYALTLVVDSVRNVTCAGGSNGIITVSASGGVSPYEYSINGISYQPSSSFFNLSPGNYTVIAKDNNGCQASVSATIQQSGFLSLVVDTVWNVSCFGANDGAIYTRVQGGVSPYQYYWSNAASTDFITGLGPGVYSLTVVDASGCISNISAPVLEPRPLIAQISNIRQPRCFNDSTGLIDLSVTGGTTPYFYLWSDGTTNEDLSAVSEGTYTVTVTDFNGCSATVSGFIDEPLPLSLGVSTTGSRCISVGSGSVRAIVTGGQPPYIFSLNGILQTDDSFDGLLPGNYALLVRDSRGCEAATSFNINSLSNLNVNLKSDKVELLTGMTAEIKAVAASSKPIIKYLWEPEALFDFSNCTDSTICPNPTVAPKVTTLFRVTVFDEDSCTASDTLLIKVLNRKSNFIPTAITPNGDGLNDKFVFDILGAEEVQVKIYNRWGNLIYENPAQKNGLDNISAWDGTFKGSPVQLDTYVYYLKVRYFDGSEENITGTVAILR
ncbi:MAG: Ig-like domain-containing protein [Chitinophagales bacterium]|nr:Ig-like domain-containing protein [Chitinophagales bacterium]